jgi:DNA-binding response OmpR family regulator
LKILVAEDELNIALSYKRALEQHKHEVIITPDGEKCLSIYKNTLEKMPHQSEGASNDNVVNHIVSPFDAVILDYKMPKKDGMEVAKEILESHPNQRIIFASAYVKDTLVDSVKQLKQIVELMQKPFDAKALVDTIEDVEIYNGLEKLNVNVKKIKDFNPTHEEIRDFLEGLREIMKGRTF